MQSEDNSTTRDPLKQGVLSQGCLGVLVIKGPRQIDGTHYPRVETLRTELREAGFDRLSALDVASQGFLPDSGPYRAKVFSCLRSLSEEIYQQGLARLEADLVQGPVSFKSK